MLPASAPLTGADRAKTSEELPPIKMTNQRTKVRQSVRTIGTLCTLRCEMPCINNRAVPIVVASARVAHVMSLAKRNSRACTLDLPQA